MEPEWSDARSAAHASLERLGELWRTQRGRVTKYGDEQGLEHAFIQPVFEEVGWALKYQTHLEGRKPDYALFLSEDDLEAALSAGRTSPDFWKYPALLADAKAWDLNLDRPSMVGNQREYPPQQLEWYLDRSRVDFGILTNGRYWRLIPRDRERDQPRFHTYLECDLARILDEWLKAKEPDWHIIDDFLHFFLFFGPAGHRATELRRSLVKRALEGSSEYRIGVGEGLKDQTFEALRHCIEGFVSFARNGLDPKTEIEVCRKQSFTLLFRLLFIMYGEDRGLLPIGKNRLYTENRSLRRQRDEIASRLDRIAEGREGDYSRHETSIWAGLRDLFDLIDRGHGRYDVPAYNGGLFDREAHPFLEQKQIADWYMARIIDRLSRAGDSRRPAAGLFRVDYRDLAIQHLGTIYEGLLELHPHHASERMTVVRRRVQGRVEERVIPAKQAIPDGFSIVEISYPQGSIYLQTEKGERRATGSYYTPDHIVDYIVENALGPVCRSISEELSREIDDVQKQHAAARNSKRVELAERIAALRRDFDDRILRLRVLDPAMGSGHFLLRACQYLAEEIATHPNTGDALADDASRAATALGFWKRRVVECCLYGVDVNDLAVELAKLALWLETVAIDRPLTFLDHHLKYGNSLIGARLEKLGVLPGEMPLVANEFVQQVEEKLPLLLEPLAKIREAPSDTTEQVKAKQRLFSAFEKAREPFRLVADAWCSSFAGEPRHALSAEQYQKAVGLLGRPNLFSKLSSEPWFQGAIEMSRRSYSACFHWELEFPEVFFEGGCRRANPGFAAIIGNPPYDVLSELETGRDLSALREFVGSEPAYQPSHRGKNNLYKLFICRALDLLADGGYLGFITPMALLGDDQAADLRRKIVEVGSFASIEAFPQKDEPANRIFAEAKLSTVVFTLMKGKTGETQRREFQSRVHPGRVIEATSPGLKLSTESIPQYDSTNLTIVSCSQADWGLATRIMSSGRMARLGQFAQFFQGEVNETNERKKGNLTNGPRRGKLVTRGASICLYVVRPASQGSDLFVDVERFLASKGSDTKAYHHRLARVGWQESSPQNNFRRIIAALIGRDEFCNHTVNYLPSNVSANPLEFVLALLNSKLADWYFRLGSTNAHVSHYQIGNLPCPVFADDLSNSRQTVEHEAMAALRRGDTDDVFRVLGPQLAEAPFSLSVRAVMVETVKIIMGIEAERGNIARNARSSLDPAAQPYQDLIDRLFYAMTGLSGSEATGLEKRLAAML